MIMDVFRRIEFYLFFPILFFFGQGQDLLIYEVLCGLC